MVILKEVKLPECHSLDVEEVNLSTATLLSAGPYVGKVCEAVNNEFMLCRQETKDPRACLNQGRQVTACALSVFRSIKKECKDEFNQYANCVDKSSGDYSLQYCRKTQAVFDKCMKDKLCIERPEFGYFCRARIHETPRPAPPLPPCPCKPRVADPTPHLPDCAPKQPARFGSRFFWMTE